MVEWGFWTRLPFFVLFPLRVEYLFIFQCCLRCALTHDNASMGVSPWAYAWTCWYCNGSVNRISLVRPDIVESNIIKFLLKITTSTVYE